MAETHRLIVVGAGPAGLTAAIYAGRAGVSALVLEQLGAGGQVTQTVEIENYPGFAKVDGQELAARMREQAEKCGATIKRASVKGLRRENGLWIVETARGEFAAESVIAATGARRRHLEVPGETEYAGAGVSYCATCDGMFFRGKKVAVVGGGSVAFEDALYLSRICEHVTLIHRRDSFRAEPTLVERVRDAENIDMKLFYTVAEIRGKDGLVSEIELASTRDGSRETLEVGGVFVAVGTLPETEWLSGHAPLDDGGYVDVDECCAVGDGLFVAGDCRRKPIYQIVTACADGAVSANAACAYLEK